MGKYNDACAEVSIILNFLDENEYNKIPANIIEVIEKNKNKEHIFVFDENIELRKQKLLEETRAILYNLFRDYLSTIKQKNKIIEMQKEERYKLEEAKSIKYNIDTIFNKDISKNISDIKINETQAENSLLEIEKENFIAKIINKVKKILKK